MKRTYRCRVVNDEGTAVEDSEFPCIVEIRASSSERISCWVIQGGRAAQMALTDLLRPLAPRWLPGSESWELAHRWESEAHRLELQTLLQADGFTVEIEE